MMMMIKSGTITFSKYLCVKIWKMLNWPDVTVEVVLENA